MASHRFLFPLVLPGYHNTFLESVINTLTYNMCIDPLGEGHVLVTYIPTQDTWDKRIARDEGRKERQNRSKGLLPVMPLWVLTQPLPRSLWGGLSVSLSPSLRCSGFYKVASNFEITFMFLQLLELGSCSCLWSNTHESQALVLLPVSQITKNS